MPTSYFVPDGRDFDQYFEPDPTGPTVEGYFNGDGSPLRFADVNRGSKPADVAYYRGDGVDVSNVWAGIGTVAYTIPPGDMGSPNPYLNTVPIRFFGVGARTYSYVEMVMRANGTIDVISFSTNFVDDTRRTLANQRAWNDNPARLVQQGQWLANIGGNTGGYTVEFAQEGPLEWGWLDIPRNVPMTYHPYEQRGAFSNYIGEIQGLGEFSLNGDVAVRGFFDQEGLSAGNGSLVDGNGALRLYNRGVVRCTIKRNGVPQQVFFFRFHNANQWFNTRDW